MNKIEAGELTDVPNNYYKKFFNKFNEIKSLSVSEWRVVHILAFFCKRYKEHYAVDYKFKFNTPTPSKCFEVFRIKSLSQKLSSDPVILKSYIDWLFDVDIKRAKRKITSISFITYDDKINEFKLLYLANAIPSSLNRTSPLPAEIIHIMKSKGNFIISTYGDLISYYNVYKNDSSFKAAYDEIISSKLTSQTILDGIV